MCACTYFCLCESESVSYVYDLVMRLFEYLSMVFKLWDKLLNFGLFRSGFILRQLTRGLTWEQIFKLWLLLSGPVPLHVFYAQSHVFVNGQGETWWTTIR